MATDTPDNTDFEDSELFGQFIDTSVETTRTEQLYRFFDLYVYAPASVAWSDLRAKIGTTVLAFFILLGTVGTMIVPQPQVNEGPNYLSWFHDSAFVQTQIETGVVVPSLGEWVIPLMTPNNFLGTDALGQSVFKQTVHSTPAMLKMAFAGAVVATSIAVIVGTVGGYKGGRVDSVLMTLTDIVLTIPGLPLVILIASVYPPKSPFLVGLILAIDNWPGLARSLRSQVLTIREESYIEAARTMDISTGRIVGRDIISPLMPYIVINAANAARGVIFESVGLYFLGVLPFSVQNWGVMMNLAYKRGSAMANPAYSGHWLYVPMFAIILFSLGFILFAQGMDRVFNPRLRARHAKTTNVDEEDV